MPVIERARRRPGITYGLLVLAVVTVGIAGFVGFRVFPALGVSSGAGAALLGFAAAAGIASFFSPCSFPLLVMLLTRQSGAEGEARPLRFAAALATGAAGFLILLGVGVGAGGAALFGEITFVSTSGRVLRLVVGGVLVTLDLMQAGVLAWPMGGVGGAVKRRLRITSRLKDRPMAKFALFGFAYLLAGFG